MWVEVFVKMSKKRKNIFKKIKIIVRGKKTNKIL